MLLAAIPPSSRIASRGGRRRAASRALFVVTALVALGVATPARSEIYLRQKATGTAPASATCPCSITATWPAATKAGSTLVAVISANPTVTFTAPTGQGWASAVLKAYGGSVPKPVVQIFYSQNASALSGASTFTLSAAADAVLVIMELGGAASVALDYTNSGKGFDTLPNTSDPGTVTTTQADEYAIAGLTISTGGVTFSSSALTNSYSFEQTVNSTSTQSTQVMTKTLTSTATQETGATATGASTTWVGALATFKAITPVTSKYWWGTAGADCGTASWKSYDDSACPTSAAPTSSQTAIWSASSSNCTYGSNTTVAALQLSSTYAGTVTTAAGVNVTSNDSTVVATVSGGTLSAGSGTLTFKGGANVGAAGTLDLASTGTVAIGNGKSLVIDGTLKATNSATIPTIQVDGTGSYAFTVGSSGTATPVLNIDGLNVKNTDTNGLYVNTVSGSSTTFTRFDKIAFSSGTGTQLLKISAPTLYLTSSGCSFDAGSATGSTTYAVTLTGNGSNGTPDTTETRALFGGTTCANNWTVGASDRGCLNLAAGTGTTAKSDDDSDGNGVGNTPASNGAVVQFTRNTATDTAGTIVGFPAAAFDWNTFVYYSTYAAYNSASGTSPVIYVRDGTGAAKYSWTGPAGGTIVGTPRWNTVSSTHYLYVALASGQVYRLVDDGSSSLSLDGGWSPNPFDCSCTIVTPLAMDSANLYWGGTTTAPAQKVWTLGQASQSQPMGSPFTITPVITSAAPALWTSSGTTYLFIGLVGHIIKLDVTNQVLSATNDSPGTASVFGRIGIGTSGSTRVFAGDDGGNVWALDPSNFTGTNKAWSYQVSGDVIKSSPYYDSGTNTIQFGTEAGQVIALGSTGALLTGYPYTPGTASDSIRSAPLYQAGILAVGTTTGKLFFIDRSTGSGTALIRQYSFGSTESVSGIAFDKNTSRYLVSTSSASAKDGRLYTFDLIADPTSAFP